MFYPWCCGAWPNSGPTVWWGREWWGRSRGERPRCKRWWELCSLPLPTLGAHLRSRRTEIWVKFPYSQAKALVLLNWSHPESFESRMDPVSKINGYFSNEKGNFYSPTRTNKQTNISGSIASLPLHRTTAQAVQKTSLPIPLCLLRPTAPEGLSPWTCSTDRWVGAIAALAQGQTLEPIIRSVLTLLPFHLQGRQNPQLTGDICGSVPAATSCRSLPRVWSKLLLISCCWAPASSFQFRLKTISSCWCFPIRGTLWQIVWSWAGDEGRERTSLLNWGCSTAPSQCLYWRPLLLADLSKLSHHAFCFDSPSLSPQWYDWHRPLPVPSRQGEPAGHLGGSR